MKKSTHPHPLHTELLALLKKHSGNGTNHTKNALSYLGTTHDSYHISNPIKHRIAKQFIKEHNDISLQEFIGLITLLYKAPSYDEKSIAGMLIGYYGVQRSRIKPTLLGLWLDELTGWAEIDSLCQTNFTADDMLPQWGNWKKVLTSFADSKSISRRRASLVLLTKPVSQSNDIRLYSLSIEHIELLKHEKDILITKAISWLLRSLVKYHKKEVAIYIQKNIASLPKVAIRETKRKIETGRK